MLRIAILIIGMMSVALPATVFAADVSDPVPTVTILGGADANRAVAQALQAAGPLVAEFNHQGYHLERSGALVAEWNGEVGVLIPFRSPQETNRAGMIRGLIVDGVASGEAGFVESEGTLESVRPGASLGSFGIQACSWDSWWRCVLNKAVLGCGVSTRTCAAFWWNPGGFIACLGGLCGLPLVYYWFWGCCH